MDFPKWKSEKKFDFSKTFKKPEFFEINFVEKKNWKKNLWRIFHQIDPTTFCAPFWVQFSSTGKSGVYSKFGQRPQNARKRVERFVLAKFEVWACFWPPKSPQLAENGKRKKNF